jgi:Lipocalin-like domain
MPLRVWIALFVTLTAAFALSGCGNNTSKPEAEAALAVFHERFNAADQEKIWKEAREELRASTPRDQFDGLMRSVRRKLGKVVSTKNLQWQVKNQNFTTSVMLLQETQFEHGSANETFTFLVEDDQAKLLQYNINSNALVIGSDDAPANDLEGSWVFEKEVDTRADGSVIDVLTTPYVGMIVYTQDGYVAATVMPEGRKWKMSTATREELHDSVGVGASTAYAGRYEVDAANKTVVHIPLVSVDPADIGARLVRHYVVDGDRLQLSGQWMEKGEELMFTVYWTRAASKPPP